MSNGVNVSVTRVAGEAKSRVVKKAFIFLVIVPGISFAVCGAGYLAQSLLQEWFCVYCGSFNERRWSVFWFVLTHGGVLVGYLIYKWAKKNEAMAKQKEALEKAGKVAVLERILEDGQIEPHEIEEIIELYSQKSKGGRPKKKDTETALTVAVGDQPMPAEDATLFVRLLDRMEGLERRLNSDN